MPKIIKPYLVYHLFFYFILPVFLLVSWYGIKQQKIFGFFSIKDFGDVDKLNKIAAFSNFLLVSLVFLVFIIIQNLYKIKLQKEYRKKLENESCEKEKSLERALSLCQATLEATADGILVVDENRNIAGHNKLFAKMWKIPEAVLEPGNDEEAVKYVLNQVKDPEQFIRNLERYYNSEPDSYDIGEVEFKDGRIIERYTMPQRLGGKIIGRVFSFRDVTKRKKMEELLRFQATHDALTSLPNKTLLFDRITQVISLSRRNTHKAAILFFDLNRFKLINDSYGHDMGDILLQAIAERLKHCIRDSDTISRWGGDEFVILITSLKNYDDVIPIIEECLDSLGETVFIGTHNISVTTSVGVSFYPQDGSNANTLLKNADTAMYVAKSEGVPYKFYLPSMNERTGEILGLESELRYAIERGQLELYYQPLIDLSNGQIMGAEALIRWHHPTRGLVSPDNFIPMAEETGLILPIGQWVLETACAQLKEWQDKGLAPIKVAVNVSVHQFKQEDISQFIQDLLRRNALKPYCLELEVTESVLIKSTQGFFQLIEDMKKIGVNLVLDDFGTGYSSLSYLTRFSVDKIKISQLFSQRVLSDANDKAVIRAILAMAKELDLKVVAEGLETKEQVDFFRRHGCDIGQGYFYSKPIDANRFENLLRSWEPKENITILPKQGGFFEHPSPTLPG